MPSRNYVQICLPSMNYVTRISECCIMWTKVRWQFCWLARKRATNLLLKRKNSMATKVIPVKDLKKDPETLLRKCCDSGEQLVVELPDHRKVTIKALEDEDDLIDDLTQHDSAF